MPLPSHSVSKIDENALTASDAVELLSEVVAREEKEARVLKRP